MVCCMLRVRFIAKCRCYWWRDGIMEMDALDKIAASAFEGYLVRKDLCGV